MTVIEELKKPFNLLSTVIAVLSLLLSVYFYFEWLQKREPYYLLHKSSQIYNKAVSSPNITVADSSGRTVSGNIHVLELSFWNNGKIPIEPADVRTPVFIEFPEGYRLLDFKVALENKPAVTAFKVSEVLPVGNSPQIQLQWAHLDPGLGARIQFIYVGEANPLLTFGGDILDAEILDGTALLRRVGNEWTRLIAFSAIFSVGTIFVNSIEIRGKSSSSKFIAGMIVIVKILASVGFVAFSLWLLFIPKSAPV